MTPRNKKESALGKGLDALIRKDYLEEDDSDTTEEANKTSRSEEMKKTEPESPVSGSKETSEDIDTAEERKDSAGTANFSADAKIVDAVLKEVHKNPRISLWSAKSAAVLRFLKKTKPEFSISNEASLLIEDAVKDRHPEIWKLFEEKGL